MERLDELAAQLSVRPTAELRQQLLQAAWPLVEEVAQEFNASGVSIEELLRAGHLGLLNAVSNLSLQRGMGFADFARNLIRGEMRDCIRGATPRPEPPAWLEALGSQIDAVNRELTGELGRPPNLAELAGRLNLTEDGLREAFKARAAFRYTSLSADQRSTDPRPGYRLDAVQDAAPAEVPWPARARLAQAVGRLQWLAEQLLAELFGRGRDDHKHAEDDQ